MTLLHFKQFWCLILYQYSDRSCMGLPGSLVIFSWLSWALRSRNSSTGHIVYSMGWRLLEETQLGFDNKVELWKENISAKWRCLRWKLLTWSELWTSTPKPNKYLPEQICAPKTLQQQIGFLKRALPSNAYLSSGCKQHWANTASCSHFLYNDTIILGTRAGICSAWRSPLPWQTAASVPTIHLYLSFLGAMCACPPFPRLCWTLMIIVVWSCFFNFCPPFPGLRSLVSVHRKYWVVAHHSAKMGLRAGVGKRKQCGCACLTPV